MVSLIKRMKTKEEIIKEFIKETPIWYKGLPKEFHNKPCIICGIIPGSLLKLSRALTQQKQELDEQFEREIGSQGNLGPVYRCESSDGICKN